jgi:uncharacterized protein YbbC (DUF1343 family)
MERAQAMVLVNCVQKLLQDWALMFIVLGANLVATIFTPHSLVTNVQLNHTRSMSLSNLELQYDQTSAEMPIIQRKYSNIAMLLLIVLVLYQIRGTTY